jgi:ABC-type Fe3+-hydroxamate transport system substrate-binding protein
MTSVATQRVLDDLGREITLARPPQRVVSLVPSDTYNVVALGAGERLVGRTTWCEHGDGVATVGGTKDVDVEAVLALAPELVIANQEENTRKVLETLAASTKVFVSLPRTVAQGVAHLARLARMLGVERSERARDWARRGLALSAARSTATLARTAFVPIWNDPWMTFNDDTYGADVLARAGVANVFGERLRLYPLAADLGKVAAVEAHGRDVRYPRVTLDEVRARAPELVVLPDEPYAFGAADEAVLRDVLPAARVVRVSGKDLFWYGAWTIEHHDRVVAALA